MHLEMQLFINLQIAPFRQVFLILIMSGAFSNLSVTQYLCLLFVSVISGTSFGISALGVALLFTIGYFFLGSLRVFDSDSLTEANVLLTIGLLPIALLEVLCLKTHLRLLFVRFFFFNFNFFVKKIDKTQMERHYYFAKNGT